MIKNLLAPILVFTAVSAHASFEDFAGRWNYVYDANQSAQSTMPRNRQGFCEKQIAIRNSDSLWLTEWPAETTARWGGGITGWNLKPNLLDAPEYQESIEIFDNQKDHAKMVSTLNEPGRNRYSYRVIELTKISNDRILLKSEGREASQHDHSRAWSYSVILHRNQ